MNTIQKKIQKKVEEINKLISLASNSESENAYDGNLMVVDSGSSWQEPMVYKPIKFTNGVLYIEYYEPYSQKTTKEKILSKNLELDGYGTLLDIAKMYRKALKSENITFAYGGSLIGNQKRIDLNHNGKIDAEDFKLLRSSMNGAYRNEKKHVNHSQDYEVRYARKKPTRTGYKGKRNFASGGEVESAIKGYKEYTENLWKGNGYFSEKEAKSQLDEYELLLRKLNDGKLAPSKVVGGGYKNAKKVAQDWLAEQIKKYKSFIETKGLSDKINHSNFRHEISFAKRENIISENKFNELLDESNEIMDSLGETYAFGGSMSKPYSTHTSSHINKGNFNRSITNKYNAGGSLENHGLKKGDRIVKTIDGGIQQVKDKDGNIVYVNLANGERSADVPLPFDKGGDVDSTYQYDNKNKINPLTEATLKNVNFTITSGKWGGYVLGDGEYFTKDFKSLVKSKPDFFIKTEEFEDYFETTYIPNPFDIKDLEGATDEEYIEMFQFADTYITSKLDVINQLNENNKIGIYEIGFSKKTGKIEINDMIWYDLGFDALGSQISKTSPEKSPKFKELQELYDKTFGYKKSRNKYDDGGEVTYFVNKDGIRVRSKVEPKNRPTEKEWMAKHNESREARTYAGGGKVSFAEKSKAIAKKFEGKRVEPKYQKEYGKTYDKAEAKEVGNKIAGAQKAKYDAKAEKGAVVKKKTGNPNAGKAMQLAKEIRKDGEKWTDAVKRANAMLKAKK